MFSHTDAFNRFCNKKSTRLERKRAILKNLREITGISYRKMAVGTESLTIKDGAGKHLKPLAQSTITRFMNPPESHPEKTSDLRHETLCRVSVFLLAEMLDQLSEYEKRKINRGICGVQKNKDKIGIVRGQFIFFTGQGLQGIVPMSGRIQKLLDTMDGIERLLER